MRYRRLRIPGGTYIFTLVTFDRFPIFKDDDAVEILKTAVRTVAAVHPFLQLGYVVMPEHLHCIWEMPDDDDDFSTRMSLVKARFTREYAKQFDTAAPTASRARRRERAVWQRRYWEHYVQDDKELNQCLDYVHLNPVYHGFVGHPIEWKHSSFGDYVRDGVYPASWGDAELAQRTGNKVFDL
jgi:putative transposase